MPTQTEAETEIPEAVTERFNAGLVAAVVLHIVVAGGIAAFTVFHFFHPKNWGESANTAGAIAATMVDALPLPPRPPAPETAVLATEKPSIAPTPPKPATIPPPTPKEVLIPTKPSAAKPTKTAPQPAVTPPSRPQPIAPTPRKATTGEATATRIPQAIQQLPTGTASMVVQDRTFGDRFAYYVRVVNSRVAGQWYTQEADPRTSNGKRTVITFEIDRDGIPYNPRITTRSGSPTLDVSALRAVQRVDSFGPLPQGDHITVEYIFDYKQP